MDYANPCLKKKKPKKCYVNTHIYTFSWFPFIRDMGTDHKCKLSFCPHIQNAVGKGILEQSAGTPVKRRPSLGRRYLRGLRGCPLTTLQHDPSPHRKLGLELCPNLTSEPPAQIGTLCPCPRKDPLRDSSQSEGSSLSSHNSGQT